MNTATLEVPAQDAALLRHRLRERRDQLVAVHDEGLRNDEHADDLNRMLMDAHESECLAQAALMDNGEKFEGSPRVLSDVADTMLRDYLGRATELSRFSPIEYEAMGAITQSIQWWTDEAKRLDEIDRGAVA